MVHWQKHVNVSGALRCIWSLEFFLNKWINGVVAVLFTGNQRFCAHVTHHYVPYMYVSINYGWITAAVARKGRASPPPPMNGNRIKRSVTRQESRKSMRFPHAAGYTQGLGLHRNLPLHIIMCFRQQACYYQMLSLENVAGVWLPPIIPLWCEVSDCVRCQDRLEKHWAGSH